MKKKTKITTLLLTAFTVICMCVFLLACAPIASNQEPENPGPSDGPENNPVLVAEGIDFELLPGENKAITVADYITANGNTVSAKSSDDSVAVAAINGETLTVTAAAAGSTTVTLSCGSVKAEFGVTVSAVYTVTVDGKAEKVKAGESFIFPKAPEIEHKKFLYWLIDERKFQAGDRVKVNSDLTVTSHYEVQAEVISSYDTAWYIDDGQLTFKISDYINSFGEPVEVTCRTPEYADVKVDGDIVTVTFKAIGQVYISLKCGSANTSANISAYDLFTVTVDGVKSEGKRSDLPYTLPAKPDDIAAGVPFKWKVKIGDGEEQLCDPYTPIILTADTVVTRYTEPTVSE